MSPLGFKTRVVGSLIHAWQRVHVRCSLRFTSGATPANLLAASMAAEPISSTYLRPGIGGALKGDLSHHRRFISNYLDNIT